jgi:uncharacterized Zn finger protein
MSVELPLLGMPDVRDWVGERSFELGKRAYRTGALLATERVGAALRARCQGSAALPYRLEVTLGPGGIAAARCTCGLGGEGRCKHVAALLVAWLEHPDAFTEAEPLPATLEHLSRESLLTLVRRIARRSDAVADLVERELPFVTGEVASAEQVHVAGLRREAATALGATRRPHYDDWTESGASGEDEARERVRPMLELGEDYLARGRYALAVSVYRTLAEVAIECAAARDGHDGERDMPLRAVLRASADGLRRCLDGAAAPGLRRIVMQALAAILIESMNDGLDDGVAEENAGAGAILLARVAPEERTELAALIRAELPRPAESSAASDARRRRLGAFLLRLEGDALDDEAYLRLCRETGQTAALVGRLLALGRADNAHAAVAETRDTVAFLRLANLLTAQGQGAAAERLVRARARRDEDRRLVIWLKDRAREIGDAPEELALAEALFLRAPSLQGFAELRRLASEAGAWPPLRDRLLAWLGERGDSVLLAEAHLLEGDVAAALAVLEGTGDAGSTASGVASEQGEGGAPLSIRVAEAAEAAHPAAAIRLYVAEVERLVAAQGRQRYAAATEYLARVRRLYTTLGQPEEWQRLIGRLRAEHAQQAALHDELRRAGM